MGVGKKKGKTGKAEPNTKTPNTETPSHWQCFKYALVAREGGVDKNFMPQTLKEQITKDMEEIVEDAFWWQNDKHLLSEARQQKVEQMCQRVVNKEVEVGVIRLEGGHEIHNGVLGSYKQLFVRKVDSEGNSVSHTRPLSAF